KLVTSHSSSSSGVSVSPASQKVRVSPPASPPVSPPACSAVVASSSASTSSSAASSSAAGASSASGSPVVLPSEHAASRVAVTAVTTAVLVRVLSFIVEPLGVLVGSEPRGSHHPDLAVAHERCRSLQDELVLERDDPH